MFGAKIRIGIEIRLCRGKDLTYIQASIGWLP